MSIKLNTVAGTYAKRTLPLIAWIYSLFQSDVEMIRDALRTVVYKAHYEKAKTLYLYEALEKIKVDRKFTNDCVAIELHCFEEKTVQCDEYITLRFPDIKHVLEMESYNVKDLNTFKEKYIDYLVE